MVESIARCFVDVDVDKVAHFYESLVVHRAWQAANEATLMFSDAAYDRKIADCAQEGLTEELLAAQAINKVLSDAIILMVSSFSKFAAYTRRFFGMRARKHERRYKQCIVILNGMLPVELSTAMELMVVHASWHAANVRSLLWKDAAFDGREYEKYLEKFRAILPRVKSDQQRELSVPSLRQGEYHSCRQCGTLMLSSANFCSYCGTRKEARSCNSGFLSCLSEVCLGITLKLPIIRGAGSDAAERNAMSTSASIHTVSWTAEIDEGIGPTIPRFSSVESPPGERKASEDCSQPSRNLSLHAPTLLRRSNGVLEDALNAWRGVRINEGGVAIGAYLEAASRTAAIIGCMGSMVASVKSDVQGNIAKIQKNVDKSIGDLTVEGMIREELAADTSLAKACKEGSTSLAVLWLNRMLRFVSRFCSDFARYPEKPLSESVSAGYKSCLSQHHPWAVRSAISVAIRGCPSKDVFYQRLGDRPDVAQENAAPLSVAMSLVLDRLQGFMIDEGLEVPDS